MDKWKTIESAPKDGADIILYSHDDTAIGFWSDFAKDWQVGSERFTNPTHWMPVPESPQDAIVKHLADCERISAQVYEFMEEARARDVSAVMLESARLIEQLL